MTLEQYRELVQKLARKRDGEAFYNESLDHAAIIAENMFGYAHDRVSILTGKLDARVYGPEAVVDKARIFLVDPKHSLRILVEDGIEELKSHPLMKLFCNGKNAAVGKHGNAEIRKVPDDLRGTYKFHFLVTDGDSYRFEQDKTKPVAVAAFGEAKGGANLEGIFNKLWDACADTAAKPK